MKSSETLLATTCQNQESTKEGTISYRVHNRVPPYRSHTRQCANSAPLGGSRISTSNLIGRDK